MLIRYGGRLANIVLEIVSTGQHREVAVLRALILFPKWAVLSSTRYVMVMGTMSIMETLCQRASSWMRELRDITLWREWSNMRVEPGIVTAYYHYGSALEIHLHRRSGKGRGMIDRPHAWWSKSRGEFLLGRHLQSRGSGLVDQEGCQSYKAVPLFSLNYHASSLWSLMERQVFAKTFQTGQGPSIVPCHTPPDIITLGTLSAAYCTTEIQYTLEYPLLKSPW